MNRVIWAHNMIIEIPHHEHISKGSQSCKIMYSGVRRFKIVQYLGKMIDLESFSEKCSILEMLAI